MKNIALRVAYDGAAFSGWQRQENAPSVQQTLERALETALGHPVALIGAGRTDAGVHALGQVCNFRSDTPIPADRMAYVLNRLLPDTVRVQASFEVPAGFHARYLARGKHYRYVMRLGPFASPLWRQRAWQSPYELDLERMIRAARLLEGTHDFRAFCASGSAVKTTVRTIWKIKVTRQGSLVYFDFYGNGFLYNMVRILVGTLVYVGQGRMTDEDVAQILAQGDRRRAGITAPACGLYMVCVYYSRRTIAFLRPRVWPTGRKSARLVRPIKMKEIQLTHACHKYSRVFAQKEGKILNLSQENFFGGK